MKPERLLPTDTDRRHEKDSVDMAAIGKKGEGLSSLFDSDNEVELRQKMLQLSSLIPNIKHVSKY